MKKKKIIISIIVSLLIVNIVLITPIGKTITTYGIDMINTIKINVESSFKSIGSYFINNQKVSNENSTLIIDNNVKNQKIEELTNENNIIKSDNQNLLNQLNGNTNVSTSIHNFSANSKIINGEIIARNVNAWNQSATINLGSSQGIEVGEPIINNGSLIGFVINVNENDAEIQLLSIQNKDLNIPIMVVSGDQQINGIIQSYDAGSQELIIQPIDSSQNLNIGDKVYTNGYQKNVVKGIPVGTINKINNGGNVTYQVKLGTSITEAQLIGVVTNA